MAGEAPSSLQPGGTWLPSANVVSPYWIRYENRTFLNKGKGLLVTRLFQQRQQSFEALYMGGFGNAIHGAPPSPPS